ncbi:UNVERIFIED_CONTAM: hypothetical protein HDU68_007895 [Siphonaria sp. JEL0065]|nr:hypothetical protein HDU68_007895 [Siphonaria sp. JEL0065]
MKQIGKHSNVIEFLGLGKTKLYSYILMELLDNDLYQILQERSLSLIELKDAVAQIGSGLSFIHSANCGHGDLKSSNILLAVEKGEARYKICDFGVATFGEPDAGTHLYLAPECMSCNWTDGFNSAKADLWAFGILTVEMAGFQLWKNAVESDPGYTTFCTTPALLQDQHNLSVEFFSAFAMAVNPIVSKRGTLGQFMNAVEVLMDVLEPPPLKKFRTSSALSELETLTFSASHSTHPLASVVRRATFSHVPMVKKHSSIAEDAIHENFNAIFSETSDTLMAYDEQISAPKPVAQAIMHASKISTSQLCPTNLPPASMLECNFGPRNPLLPSLEPFTGENCVFGQGISLAIDANIVISSVKQSFNSTQSELSAREDNEQDFTESGGCGYFCFRMPKFRKFAKELGESISRLWKKKGTA